MVFHLTSSRSKWGISSVVARLIATEPTLTLVHQIDMLSRQTCGKQNQQNIRVLQMRRPRDNHRLMGRLQKGAHMLEKGAQIAHTLKTAWDAGRTIATAVAPLLAMM